jgi:vomeronasal1 receptor
MALRDAVFQATVGGASGYKVFLSTSTTSMSSTSKLLYETTPEIKAAQSVLLLMIFFLFFYWTNCFISLYLTFSTFENYFITVNIQEFLTLGYVILSPFLQIHRDGHLVVLAFSLGQENIKKIYASFIFSGCLKELLVLLCCVLNKSVPKLA